MDKFEANYEQLKKDSEEDPEEVTVTRMDLKRFAAQDNLGMHDAVRLGVGVRKQSSTQHDFQDVSEVSCSLQATDHIEKTMWTRSFVGMQFLTSDAAQMARRLSIRLAAENGMDKSSAIDLAEIKGALQEFDRYGDQSVFVQELGIICEVLERRPMKNTLNQAVEILRDTKLDPNAPWTCVGTPPWTAGASGCRCFRPQKGVGGMVDSAAEFVGCEHDKFAYTIGELPPDVKDMTGFATGCVAINGSAGQAAAAALRAELEGLTVKDLKERAAKLGVSLDPDLQAGSSEKFRLLSIERVVDAMVSHTARHTSACMAPGKTSWSTFCARRSKIHRYGSSDDPRKQIPSWNSGKVPGCSCGFCCVKIKVGSPVVAWHLDGLTNKWSEPADRDEVSERMAEAHNPAGLWSHMFPCGSEWRSANGLPTNIDATCEACEEKHARCVLTRPGKLLEKLAHKEVLEAYEDACRSTDDPDSAALQEAEMAMNLAEKRRTASEHADAASRMRWCEDCAVAVTERLQLGVDDSVEDIEARIETSMAGFLRKRKPQKLLVEIRRASYVFQAKSHYGEIRDKLLRRRIMEEDKVGFTPMHCAARDGKLECVRALLLYAAPIPKGAMVGLGKSVAYMWDPVLGTTYIVDPPREAERHPNLRKPEHDVWPTDLTMPLRNIWCGTQSGTGNKQGRGITDLELQQIQESTGAAIVLPKAATNKDSPGRSGKLARARTQIAIWDATQGSDALTSTDKMMAVTIEGEFHAKLDGREAPIHVARRKLKVLRVKYYLDDLRRHIQEVHSREKAHADVARAAKDSMKAASDEVVHKEREIKTQGSKPELEKELKELLGKEMEAQVVLDAKRLVLCACTDQQKREGQRIMDVEVDYQILLPSVFETFRGSTMLLAHTDLMGFTPLHWACRNGHLEVALLLIAVGSHPTALSNKGRTPLEEAEAYAIPNMEEEAEELSKLNRSTPAHEMTKLRAEVKRRDDCIAALRKECPLMDDEPMRRGTLIHVTDYGEGRYIGLKKKAGRGCCGRGEACALHTVEFRKESIGHGGQTVVHGTQHLHLKEMSWRLLAFQTSKRDKRSATRTRDDMKAASGGGDESFDDLPETSFGAEPEPLMPGQPEPARDTPSKYQTADRPGKKLEP